LELRDVKECVFDVVCEAFCCIVSFGELSSNPTGVEEENLNGSSAFALNISIPQGDYVI
jgi:hypothetical protein